MYLKLDYNKFEPQYLVISNIESVIPNYDAGKVVGTIIRMISGQEYQIDESVESIIKLIGETEVKSAYTREEALAIFRDSMRAEYRQRYSTKSPRTDEA